MALRSSSLRALAAASSAAFLLSTASAASAAPGVYAQETPASPLPAASVLDGAGDVRAFRLQGALGVTQHVRSATGAFQSVSVPICVSDGKVGHAYARRNANGFRSLCWVDGGPSSSPQPIIKPTATQLPKAVWVPMKKGQALPRLAAPVEYVGTERVPVYACQLSETIEGRLQVRVGTLLPDGACRLAPTFGAPARTVDDSMILLFGSSGAPRYGWISLVSGGPTAGGELVKWPTGQTFCKSDDGPGILTLQSNGAVDRCEPRGVINVGGRANIQVFRNDDASKLGFGKTGTEVNTNKGVPCADGAFLGVVSTINGARSCIQPNAVRSGGVFDTLRQSGRWPDAG
jgi:hypothetical protein